MERSIGPLNENRETVILSIENLRDIFSVLEKLVISPVGYILNLPELELLKCIPYQEPKIWRLNFYDDPNIFIERICE